MADVFDKVQEYAFLSGFVAAKEIPAHVHFNGVMEYAKYELHEKEAKEVECARASMIDLSENTITKEHSRYPNKFAADWIREAGLVESRSEASEWFNRRAEELGVDADDLKLQAADEYVAHYGRLEALEREAEKMRNAWKEAPTPTPGM